MDRVLLSSSLRETSGRGMTLACKTIRIFLLPAVWKAGQWRQNRNLSNLNTKVSATAATCKYDKITATKQINTLGLVRLGHRESHCSLQTKTFTPQWKRDSSSYSLRLSAQRQKPRQRVQRHSPDSPPRWSRRERPDSGLGGCELRTGKTPEVKQKQEEQYAVGSGGPTTRTSEPKEKYPRRRQTSKRRSTSVWVSQQLRLGCPLPARPHPISLF